MVLLATSAFVTFYLQKAGCHTLEAVWSDHVNSEGFREAILQGLSFVQQHRIENWIADDRRLGPLNAEDLAWIATEIMPALSAGGLRRLAVVESEDLLNRVLIEDAYTTPVHILNIEFKRFADLPAARAWACS